jgi:predicted homoserine dehydrogenase-like protein
MKFITRAEGPYYLLFRPYHLCDIETPQSIAEAVLMKERTATADFTCAEVVSVAKRDLAPGTIVGGLGGTDILGRIQTVEMARGLGAVPLGIVPGGQVLAPIRRGEIMTVANFLPDTTTFVYELRRRQDALTEPKLDAAVAL